MAATEIRNPHWKIEGSGKVHLEDDVELERRLDGLSSTAWPYNAEETFRALGVTPGAAVTVRPGVHVPGGKVVYGKPFQFKASKL